MDLLPWAPGSLYIQRHQPELPNEFDIPISHRDEWYTGYVWTSGPPTRYTKPWSAEHHPIALPLSQTCKRLADLMQSSVWVEVGLDSLKDLFKLRRGLRLVPERAALIVRLEWRCKSWYHSPPLTDDECSEAMDEVICQLPNLEALLWVSPHMAVPSQAVDFLASKSVSLKALQVALGDDYDRFALARAAYWKLAGKLEKLSIWFHPLLRETNWIEEEMTRWGDYDDDFSGLDAHIKLYLQKEVEAIQVAGLSGLSDAVQADRLARLTINERQSVVAYKTLVVACESNNLRSLAIDPLWTLSVRRLVPYWVKLEDFQLICERRLENSSGIDWIRKHAHYGKDYLWHDESNKSTDNDWGTYAEWHRGAAAIRPAMYHAARHRKEPGPLTVQDVQAIGQQGANYPASLFYPYFRDGAIAQRLLEEWEALEARGEGERVVCQCEQCR